MSDELDLIVNGESFRELIENAGGELKIRDVEGDGLIGASIQTAPIPGSDGERFIDSTLDPRILQVEYSVRVAVSASHEALEGRAEVERLVNGLLHQGTGLYEIEMSHLNGYFRGRVRNSSKPQREANRWVGVIEFYCPKPFLYGSSLTTTIAGGLVAVDSNYYVEPVIIWTTNQSVGAAWIEVDGERLTIDTSISSGQQIRIDSQRKETRIGGVLNVENINGTYPVIRDGSSITRSPGGSIEFRYQARHI